MPPKSPDVRHQKVSIPAYALYGEAGPGIFPDNVHAETIHARSSALDWRIEPHRHHGLYQAIWISDGGARLFLEGEVRSLASPSVAWIPPLVVHGYAFERGTAGIVVSIPLPTLARAFPKSSTLRGDLDRTIVVGGDRDAEIDHDAARLFEALLREFAARRPGRDEGLVSWAELLAIWFVRRGHRRKAEAGARSADAQAVQRFLAEVERTFTTRRPMPDYARAVGLSLPHLGRLCRQVTGHSALQILHERIILEAKRSLVYTALPIGEVALRLGFEDAAYFSRFFRERTGKSPQAFRALASKTGDG